MNGCVNESLLSGAATPPVSHIYISRLHLISLPYHNESTSLLITSRRTYATSQLHLNYNYFCLPLTYGWKRFLSPLFLPPSLFRCARIYASSLNLVYPTSATLTSVKYMSNQQARIFCVYMQKKVEFSGFGFGQIQVSTFGFGLGIRPNLGFGRSWL